MKHLAVLTAALLAGVVWGHSASHAQSGETAGQSPGEVIPITIVEPDTLVREMASLLSSTETFTLHIEKTFDEVQSDGAKVQFSGAADIAIRRPDRFYVDYGGGHDCQALHQNSPISPLRDGCWFQFRGDARTSPTART